MLKKRFYFLLMFFLLVACGENVEEQKEIVVSDITVSASDFESLKNWNDDDLSKAMEAFELSCDKILSYQGDYLGNSKIKISLPAYQNACEKLPLYDKSQYKNFLKDNFVPYLISYKGNDKGKFTSYYEMTFNASRQKNDDYRFPVYNRPADLLEINLQDFDKNLPNRQLTGRLVGQKLVPYYTRKEIREKAAFLRATPIVFAKNMIDVFVLQIQGSGVAVFEDGSQQRIGYAANNGHKFKGIGSILLEKNKIKKNETDMLSIKKWMYKNYREAVEYMDENPRYIFHKQIISSGPLGAQGVPLTGGRSLAVDTDYIPLGSMLWLETFYPDKGDLGKLMVAQDIGSAIKGPIRGDYFWGTGGDEILKYAGEMNSAGRYFILVPKNTEVIVQ